MPARFTAEKYFLVRFQITSEPSAEVWKQQGRYQKELADTGILMMCGPLTDQSGAAMAVLKVPDRQAAEAAYRHSPIVTAGHAQIAVEPWTVSVRADTI